MQFGSENVRISFPATCVSKIYGHFNRNFWIVLKLDFYWNDQQRMIDFLNHSVHNKLEIAI